MSLREKIMATPRLGDPVDVPEWNQRVYVRPLSPADIEKIRQENKGDEENALAVMSWQVAHGLVDEAGQRIFSDEDIGWLHREAGFDLLQRLTKAITDKTFGTTEEDVEESEKN